MRIHWGWSMAAGIAIGYFLVPMAVSMVKGRLG